MMLFYFQRLIEIYPFFLKGLWMTVAVGGTALGALGVGVLIDYLGFTAALTALGFGSLVVFAILLQRIWR